MILLSRLEFLQTKVYTKQYHNQTKVYTGAGGGDNDHTQGHTHAGEAELISTFGNTRPLQCRGGRTVWYTGNKTMAKPCPVEACDTLVRVRVRIRVLIIYSGQGRCFRLSSSCCICCARVCMCAHVACVLGLGVIRVMCSWGSRGLHGYVHMS